MARKLEPITSAEVINSNSSSMDDATSIVCTICLDQIKNQQIGKVGAICQHLFCASCILEWYKTGKAKCPICRRTMSAVYVYEGIEEVNSLKFDYYYPKCLKCHLIVNASKDLFCGQCYARFHHSCMGIGTEVGDERIAYLCLDCEKLPVHQKFCSCMRCLPRD